MPLVLTSGPAVEPVSVSEAKAHLRLDPASTAEDILIASLILTSRLHIEAALGLALITQSWTQVLDAWPVAADAPVLLAMRPLQTVTSVAVRSADGVIITLSPSQYVLDRASAPPRIVRPADAVWPPPGKSAAGIEIAFTAGFGPAAADVPAPIRQALLLLVAHWYEHRDPIEIGAAGTLVPPSVSDLLEPYRIKRL
jgi:uncharacterized phiE125 gp8 family phage protein